MMDRDLLKRYKGLLESIKTGAFLLEDGVLLYQNAEARRLLGPQLERLPEEMMAALGPESGILSCTGIFEQDGVRYDLSCTPLEGCRLVLLQPQGGEVLGDPMGLPLSAAFVAQEFREPLSVLFSGLRQLSGRLSEGESDRNRKTLSAMYQNSFRLLRLSGNLSDYTRMCYGEVTLRSELDDFVAFCRRLWEGAVPLARKAGVRLEFSASPSRILTCFDKELCERMVYNLLSNALKASPAGSAVQMRLSQEGESVFLLVADQGRGISREVLPFVFDRYAMGARREGQDSGFGLGLALVKSIASLHGGSVALQSKAGEGTRITVSLPMRLVSGYMLREPMPQVDYSGGFSHALLELSDALPLEAYEL